MATIIIGLAVFGAAGFVLRGALKKKKKGASSCGSCEGCPGCGPR